MFKRKTKTKFKTLSPIDPVTGWRLFYPDRKTTLYYVRFEHHKKYYYKIGITTQSITKRFAGETVPYKVLWKKSYKSGRTAYEQEQKVLGKHYKEKYWGPNILKSGNSELFTKDIMKGAL